MDTTNQFSITCSSHEKDAQVFFNSNTYSNFKSQLPQSINLKDWEVALANIIFPKGLRTITPFTLKIGWIETADDDIEIIIDTLIDNTVTKIIRRFNNEILAHPIFENAVRMRYNDEKMCVEVHFEQRNLPLKNYYLEYRWKENQTTRSFRFTNARVCRFDKSLSRTSIHVTRPCNIGLVYCDIVKPSVVGSEMCPLLHFVPLHDSIDKVNDHKSMYQPQHLIFHDVIDREFSNIGFQICEPDGELHRIYNSENENNGIGITLLFRAKKDVK